MPSYNPSPFARVPMALPGRPIWVLGQLVDTTGPTVFQVKQVQATGGTATITGLITAGVIPDLDDLISITGLANTVLNVTNTPITAVTINATTGYGTISFASTATIALVNDAGSAIIPHSGDPEIVAANQASMAVSIPDSPEGKSLQGFSAEVDWAASAEGGAVAVQVADVNRDAAYQTLGTITFPATRFDTPAGISANFVRLLVTAVSGNGSMCGRILVR